MTYKPSILYIYIFRKLNIKSNMKNAYYKYLFTHKYSGFQGQTMDKCSLLLWSHIFSNLVPIVLQYFKHCPHRTAYFQTLSPSYCIFLNIFPIVLHISNIVPIVLHIFKLCPNRTAYFQTLNPSYCIFLTDVLMGTEYRYYDDVF